MVGWWALEVPQQQERHPREQPLWGRQYAKRPHCGKLVLAGPRGMARAEQRPREPYKGQGHSCRGTGVAGAAGVGATAGGSWQLRSRLRGRHRAEQPVVAAVEGGNLLQGSFLLQGRASCSGGSLLLPRGAPGGVFIRAHNIVC